MTSTSGRGPAADQGERSLTELCRSAVASTERGLKVAPEEVPTEVETAQRAIAHVRDRLIARLRQEGDSPDAPRLRSALDRINAALSLVIGVEYPTSGVRRASLEQACRLLDDLTAGWLP